MIVKILIADDDPATHACRSGYETIAAADGAAAWEFLERSPPDANLLAILDCQMPRLDGVDLTARIKADPHARFTYLVMLTSRSGTRDIVAAMGAGADDFITKPFEPEELKVRVRAGARVLEMQAELRRRASRDELSAALTRRWVLALADRELPRAHREGTPLSVAMIDIDHSEVAERMRMAITALPVLAGDASLGVTVSVGVTTAWLDGRAELPSLPALVHSADRALYLAKGAGRDRVMSG